METYPTPAVTNSVPAQFSLLKSLGTHHLQSCDFALMWRHFKHVIIMAPGIQALWLNIYSYLPDTIPGSSSHATKLFLKIWTMRVRKVKNQSMSSKQPRGKAEMRKWLCNIGSSSSFLAPHSLGECLHMLQASLGTATFPLENRSVVSSLELFRATSVEKRKWSIITWMRV